MEGITIREVREDLVETRPLPTEIRTKVCQLCGKEKDLDEFPKNESCKNGHESQCKACKSDKGRKRYREKKKIPIVNPTPKATYSSLAKPRSQPQPTQPVVLFDRYPEILESLKRAAAEQVRTLEEQICWYVKKGLKLDAIRSNAELDGWPDSSTIKPSGCGNWRGPE